MTVDEIRELIHLATETGIAELEVQRGDNRVRIRRATFAAPQEITLAPPAYTAPAVPVTSAKPVATAPALEAPADTEAKADPGRHLVKSPIVGTFYDSP